ncbi:DUF4350 domain-containing protein [Branchiibius sp. NY16-3462-2]|uniref:DUF4350 domain-containing protein n=1 Tax=Branchiibius sp. NY16-3462-2 TaxID=1807500 RepID=UPI0007991BFB|nr:DUF4350 domain-containing protein [Branchiibius sp. NY16-3462-2]KYH43027.1 hypothetical protein AZH51_06135 [Branchiibius sp. NY16-3462-2]
MKRHPWAFWGAVALLLIVVSAFLASRQSTNPTWFDPDNPAPVGGQAIARVLSQTGVDVTPVRSLDDLMGTESSPQDTILISDPDLLDPGQLHNIQDHFSSAYRIVLLAPDPPLVDVPFASEPGSGCTIDWLDGLQSAGRSTDVTYDDTTGHACLAREHGYAAVQLDDNVLLLGATGAIANDSVLKADNAAIGLRALGGSKNLLWFSGDAGAAGERAGGLPWPDWWSPMIAVLAAATVALMLWRGRRLGRLVREPLPVVVPAQETTNARGRLYRKAKDTDRAAQALRAATRTRVSTYLGTPDVVRAAATQTGRTEQEIATLLLDGPVVGDAELVHLANELTTLERQVRPQ